jgi:hypothetical protein
VLHIVLRPWRDVRKDITRHVGGTWSVQYTCVIAFRQSVATGMASMASKFKVPRFDGTGNFGLWQTRVKDLLTQ